MFVLNAAQKIMRRYKMPTVYTAQIQEGISFEKFVMSCARAFGACITMRDDPADKPIPDEFKPSNYHQKCIKEIQKEISLIESYDDDKCESLAFNDYQNEKIYIENCIEEEKNLKKRYTVMFERVNNWNPPTSEHQGLKDFMIEQITSSIEFDCDTKYSEDELSKLQLKSGTQWKSDKLIQLNDSLVYHTKQNAEEIERVNGRNLWIKQLRESLK